MSAYARPISAAQFAAALPDLPLSALHAKAAEIQNSTAHLRYSNSQLQQYAEAGDKDCQEAIDENLVVIARQEERIGLLRDAVEQRGYIWADAHGANGTSDADMIARLVPDDNSSTSNTEANPDARAVHHSQGGRIDDEEMARRLADRMDEDNEGLHL